MNSARRSLPFGAELVDPTHTRFRLWAPDARSVDVVVDGARSWPMDSRSEGWFDVRVEVGAGTRYRYRIDDAFDVPDPAARAMQGGVEGWSIVVDPTRYAWRQLPWRGRAWHEAVAYEVHAGLYGGFDGVREQLEDLAALGITAVELMPIGQFPGTRNWGYDGVLPFAPAECYGSPDALKALVDRAHELGLMMILDVVYNHFGPQGNHLPRYASAFFDPSKHTPWGAGIAFARPEVQAYFLENALYWLHEYRFDGLRIDAAHAIGDTAFLHELARRVGEPRDDGCRRQVIFENENNAAELLDSACASQWNDDAHHVLHVLLTGEHESYYADYVERSGDLLARWLSEGFIYQGEPMRHWGGRARGTPSGMLRPTAFVNALQNHDQVGNRAQGDRLAASVPHARLLAAYALLLLNPQIPMLFMGEDWASTVPFLYFTDYAGELADAVREGRRREFAHFATFAGEGVPDPNAPSSFDRSRPDFGEHERPFRSHIHALIALRQRHIVPGIPGARSLGAHALGAGAVDARWRLGDGRILRIVANLTENAVRCESSEATPPLHATSASGDQAQAPPWSCTTWLVDAPA